MLAAVVTQSVTQQAPEVLGGRRNAAAFKTVTAIPLTSNNAVMPQNFDTYSTQSTHPARGASMPPSPHERPASSGM